MMTDESPVQMTGSMILSLIWTFLVAMILFALAGCSSGGDGSPDTGRMSVSVTDAAVDDASSVVVQFSGVAFKREGESPETVQSLSSSPRQLNLLEYQEGR